MRALPGRPHLPPRTEVGTPPAILSRLLRKRDGDGRIAASGQIARQWAAPSDDTDVQRRSIGHDKLARPALPAPAETRPGHPSERQSEIRAAQHRPVETLRAANQEADWVRQVSQPSASRPRLGCPASRPRNPTRRRSSGLGSAATGASPSRRFQLGRARCRRAIPSVAKAGSWRLTSEQCCLGPVARATDGENAHHSRSANNRNTDCCCRF